MNALDALPIFFERNSRSGQSREVNEDCGPIFFEQSREVNALRSAVNGGQNLPLTRNRKGGTKNEKHN